MPEQSSYARKAKWLPYLMVPLFLIGLFMVYQRLAYESRDFYAEYFEFYPISTSSNSSPQFNEGMKAISTENYAQSEKILHSAFKLDKDPEVGMHLAMARMGEGKYWEAIDVLQEIKDKYPDYLERAEWYKILALIGLERKDDVIPLLEYYCEQPDFEFKKKEAHELLNDY
jgi:tetratricopeptide (TPR) repeat protein